MKNRIITIGREFGSGGRTIGKKVAEKLGIPCYDAGLLQKIAEKAVSLKTTSKMQENMLLGIPFLCFYKPLCWPHQRRLPVEYPV